MLIQGLIDTQEPHSLFVAKNRKIADRAAKPNGDDTTLTTAQKAAQQAAAEKAREENDWEYYGWDIAEYKQIELINSVRAANYSGDIKDFPYSHGPGDRLAPAGPTLIPQTDEAALLAAFAV